MAEAQNAAAAGTDANANANANAQTQAGQGDDKGKGQGADKNNQNGQALDSSKFISKEDYDKALIERDGTISALTKKVDTLTSGLTTALGIEGEGKNKPTTEQLIEGLQTQIQTLTSENKQAKVGSAVAGALNDYKDEKGNTLTANAKAYLQKQIASRSLELKDVGEVVQAEIKEFITIFGDANNTTKGKDNRPAPKHSNTGRDFTKPSSANEILKNLE